MEIQTASICVGGSACPNACPFCVAEQTPSMGVQPKPSPVDWRKFGAFLRAISMFRISTVLLTSKGEALIWKPLITDYLKRLQPCGVPFVELHTSGVLLQNPESGHELDTWADLGLTTVALSVVHYDDAINAECYRKPYPPLVETIKRIRSVGLTVRLNCMLVKGWIDTPEGVNQLLAFAKANDVAQVTIRPITASDTPPPDARAAEVQAWTRLHTPDENQLRTILNEYDGLGSEARLLQELPHGAKVFDVNGQNLCVSNCLTHDPNSNTLRQIIWIDNQIIHDWRFPGARLL